MNIIHKDMNTEDGIHAMHSFEVLDELGLSSLELIPEDVHKIILIESTNQFVKIDSVDPLEVSNLGVSQDDLDLQLEGKVNVEEGKGLSDENFTVEFKEVIQNLEPLKFRGFFTSVEALELAHPNPPEGSFAHVDLGAGEDISSYIFDVSDSKWVKQKGISASLTAPEVRNLYLSNTGTEEFNTELKIKLSNIEEEANKTVITQTIGTSEAEVMSQNAVNLELEKKLDKESVVQDYGTSETEVMSQKAVTDKFTKRGENGKGLLLENLDDVTTDSGSYICNLSTLGTFPFVGFPKLGTTVSIIKVNDTFTSQILRRYTDSNRLWVRTAREDAWLDGWVEILTSEFITQESGQDESLVMSQKAVTDMVQDAVISGGGVFSTAALISFNNTLNDFLSENVQDAILELNSRIPTELSADNINETTTRKFVTTAEKTQITANTDEINEFGQRITDLETIDSSTLGIGKVKLNDTDDLEFLSKKVDGTTLAVQSNKLKVLKLEGMLATLQELNYLTGVSSNIQSQINNLSNVGNFTGTVDTFADLAITFPMPDIGDLVIVLADETNSGDSTIYLSTATGWEFAGGFTSEGRDFLENPIDLSTEVYGILPKDKYVKQNAAETPILNTDGNFSATSVEEALAELFTLTDSFKKGVVASIGSPLLYDDSKSEVESKILALKGALTNSVTLKGVPAYPYNTFEEIANKIDNIPTTEITAGVKTTSEIEVTSTPETYTIILDSALLPYQISTSALIYTGEELNKPIYKTDFPGTDSNKYLLDDDKAIVGSGLKKKSSWEYTITEDAEDNFYTSAEVDFSSYDSLYAMYSDIDLYELELNGIRQGGEVIEGTEGISLVGIDGIVQINSEVQEEGSGIVKFALSFDNGATWHSRSSGSWTTIDISNKAEFASDGISSSDLNSLSKSDFDSIVGESEILKISYYVDTTLKEDRAVVLEMTILADIKGIRQLASTDNYNFTYDLSTQELTYTFKEPGKYLINYADGD